MGCRVLKEPPKNDTHQLVCRRKDEIRKLKNRRDRAAKLGHEVSQAGQENGAGENPETKPAQSLKKADDKDSGRNGGRGLGLSSIHDEISFNKKVDTFIIPIINIKNQKIEKKRKSKCTKHGKN